MWHGDDEFHVDTPQKDGGKKKKMKYGWMEGEKKLYGGLAQFKPPLPKPERRSIDAIFIARLLTEAVAYAKMMNYNPKNVLLLIPSNYKYRLDGMKPDEDVIIHICGSWLNEYASYDDKSRLAEVVNYLYWRDWDFVEVPEIGKDNS